jgi:hypothetical protein
MSPALTPFVFDGHEVRMVDTPSIFVAGVFARELSRAASLFEPDPHNAFNYAVSARNTVIDTGFWNDVTIDLWLMFVAFWHTERLQGELSGVQPRFKASLPRLLPGAKLIPVSSHRRGRCDFLIELEGEHRPVEVKRCNFASTAKAQLRRYMDFYGSSKGYAAAPNLTCVLDEDMEFLPIDVQSNELYPSIERDLQGHLEFNFADDQTLLFPFMLEGAK